MCLLMLLISKKFTFKVLLLKNIVNNQPIIKFSMFLDYELTGGCVNAIQGRLVNVTSELM